MKRARKREKQKYRGRVEVKMGKSKEDSMWDQ